MVAERQRQQLLDAIFDILVNHIYSALAVAEKSSRIGEFYELATTIENVIYRDHPDENLQLFDPARLLIKLITCPSISARCT